MSRRLRRMQIVKQKRALGLINIANSYAVRYNQKRLTALQKCRSNGKFVSEYFPVCSCKRCKATIVQPFHDHPRVRQTTKSHVCSTAAPAPFCIPLPSRARRRNQILQHPPHHTLPPLRCSSSPSAPGTARPATFRCPKHDSIPASPPAAPRKAGGAKAPLPASTHSPGPRCSVCIAATTHRSLQFASTPEGSSLAPACLKTCLLPG